MRDIVFPVCAPSLLNNKPLRRFSDICSHTLLHDIDIDQGDPTITWQRWFRDVEVAKAKVVAHVEFNGLIFVTEVAERGKGISLGRMSLVRDHLATGRLVRPFKISR